MASIEELRAAVLGIPGVVGAEVVDAGSGPPTVRVWTDASRDPVELRAEIQELVARGSALSLPVAPAQPDEAAMRPLEAAAPVPAKPRGGLGRDLDTLIAVAGEDPVPAQLVPVAQTPRRLELVAVEESAAGVAVRAVDSAGMAAEAKVIGGHSAVNPAIVAAVAELLGEAPAPRLVSVELRDTEVAAVLVVTLELGDTEPAAGAAVVRSGMPFTLGRATWNAISAARA